MNIMIPPISQQIPPQRIRVGDRVVVTNPEFVTRVGYPMSYADALEYVEKNYTGQVVAFVEGLLGTSDVCFAQPEKDKDYKKILSAMAHMRLDAEHHGGRERSIHTLLKPEMQGKTFEVVSKKVVKTGTYYPPWSQQSYEGEWDGGPGGLDNCKTHVVLELQDYTMYWNFKNKWGGCWIESCNVRKV